MVVRLVAALAALGAADGARIVKRNKASPPEELPKPLGQCAPSCSRYYCSLPDLCGGCDYCQGDWWDTKASPPEEPPKPLGQCAPSCSRYYCSLPDLCGGCDYC